MIEGVVYLVDKPIDLVPDIQRVIKKGAADVAPFFVKTSFYGLV